MTWRTNRAIDPQTLLGLMAGGLFTYAAWLTSIVYCSANHMRPLMIAAAAFFPVGVVHGIGIWFGGW